MATITSTIGTTGRNYSTIQAWEDALPADLVAVGNAYVGELYPDTEFTFGSSVMLTIAGQTTSSTCSITLRPAAGASFRDHASVRTNALTYDATKGVGLRRTTTGYNPLIDVTPANVILDGLQIDSGSNGKAIICRGGSATLQNSIVIGGAGFAKLVQMQGGGNAISNALIVKYGSNVGDGLSIQGGSVSGLTLTNIGSGSSGFIFDYGTLSVKNSVVTGFTTNFGATNGTLTATNNATNSATVVGTAGLTSIVPANVFVDPASDWRLKAGSALIDAGTAFGAAFDISGTARPQGAAYDIGAWEVAATGAGATATPPGVTASSAVGSVIASGQAKASPAGVSAAASVGTATASGSTVVNGTAQPVGVSATAAVGAATAQGAASSTAQPAGVAASAAVGTASASGQGKATPAGVTATSAVGAPFATGQTIVKAFPAGVQAVASVGIATGKGNAIAAPLGVVSQIYVGTVNAHGPVDNSPQEYFLTTISAAPLYCRGAMDGSAVPFRALVDGSDIPFRAPLLESNLYASGQMGQVGNYG